MVDQRGADAGPERGDDDQALRPFAAPYRASARPAASASLTTCTSRPVASVNSASASVPTQASSMFAAEWTTPWRTTPGTVTPTGPREPGKWREQLDEDLGHGVGGRGRGRLDPLALLRELALLQVDRRALDAGAAEVDAEGKLLHRSNLFRSAGNRSPVAGLPGSRLCRVPTQLTTAQHLAGLSEAMRAFVRYADRAGLEAPVPTCPDWTVLDLVAHQGMVHRWARRLVRGERPSDEEVDGVRGVRQDRRGPVGVAERRRGRAGPVGHGRARGPRGAGLPERRAPGPRRSGPAGSATRPRSTRSTRWPRPSAGPRGPTRSGSTPSWPATASTSCSAGS